MKLPTVHQPSVASDDSAKDFVLKVADAWLKSTTRKPSLSDIDESEEFFRAADKISARS